jgi:hypothetical protein
MEFVMNTRHSQPSEQPSGQRNEGEGNRTAARAYNKATTEFTKSGEVESKAREAKRAVDSAEGEKLREAEREGQSHSHGEDPELRRKSH